jgi:RimJ/RimL family protein N-acetyltransferase
MIETPRLRLIPATAALVEAEIANLEGFARSLDARVPDNWPPALMFGALPFFRQQLTRHPELVGWLSWYWVRQGEEELLVGCGGFKGAPRPEGTVEVGYSVLPQFQRRGYATEAVGGLLQWAFQTPKVACTRAETFPTNVASIRVLEKLGFRPAGPGSEPGTIRWELPRAEA